MAVSRRLLRLAQQSTLGRNTGPQLFWSGNTPLTTPTQLQPNRNLDTQLPIESITVVVSGRAVIAVADYTTPVPEAQANIVDRIQIRGTHRRYTGVTPIDMSGASCFQWPRLFQSFGNDMYLGNTRMPDAGIPFVNALNPGLSTGQQGTYDFRNVYEIPVGVLLGPSPSAKSANIPFLWRPEDWGSSLQLTLWLGDKTSFGTPAATTTTTFTAYGSAAGTPLVEVYINYSLMGAWSDLPNAGLVIRSEYIANPALTGVVAQQQLGQALAHQITTNLVIKSGIALTGTTSGVNVFKSLSDLQLTNTKVVVGNKFIRNLGGNYVTKNQYSRAFNTTQPQGYLLVPFVDGGSPLLAFRADDPGVVPPGANLAIVTDVLTASADNKQTIIQEQVFGGPYLRRSEA